jgi:hypothetical protein
VADSRAYASPSAFRRALTDRLKALAATSRWNLPQLQRQIAYDRLLERLYLMDDKWIVKGATSLLARDIGVRGTRDVDIYREAAREVAERDLRNSASRDAGDWFRLELAASQPTSDGARGVRVPVTAHIGTTPVGYRSRPSSALLTAATPVKPADRSTWARGRRPRAVAHHR